MLDFDDGLATGFGISGTYDASTGELILSGTASADEYQQVLRTVTYRNTSATPNTAARELLFVIGDDYDESTDAYPICVILHGSGSTELEHGKYADLFGRQGVIYVAPRAPYPHLGTSVQLQRLGWTAWSPDADRFPADEEDALQAQIVEQYVDWIFACVDDTRTRYRTRGDSVFLFGSHGRG